MNYRVGGWRRPDKTREIKNEINIHLPHFFDLTMSWFFFMICVAFELSVLPLSQMKSKTPKMWCLNQTHTKRDEFQNKHINLICWMFLQLVGRKWILYMNCLSFFLPSSHLACGRVSEAKTRSKAFGPWHGVNVWCSITVGLASVGWALMMINDSVLGWRWTGGGDHTQLIDDVCNENKFNCVIDLFVAVVKRAINYGICEELSNK